MKNLFTEKAKKPSVFLALLFTFIIGFYQSSKAQTTLSAGDVALSSYNAEGNNDSFAFMLTRSIASGTKFVITDGGWNDGSADFAIPSITQDWFMEWEATAAMSAGDQVQIWNPAASTNGTAFPAVSAGKINKGRMLSLATSGDQIFIIQNPTIDSVTNNNITGGTVICGLHANYVTGSTNGSNWDNGVAIAQATSELPPGLTTGVNAVMFNCIGCSTPAGSSNEVDNMRYTCVGSTAADLNDSANWEKNDQTAFSPTLCVNAAPTSTTWTGTWSNGAPSSTIDAIIASSTTPGAFTCKDLTINSTFTLTLGSGVIATIHGGLTNNGNGTSGVGTLNFAGTTQALSGTAFTHSGVVEVSTGSTLTTNSKLTLANGASLMHGTSTPNGGGSVSGSITFEKAIGSSTYGWRMFSLPVDELIDNFNTGLVTRCSNSTPTDRRNVYYWDGTNIGSNVAAGFTQANNTTDDENKAYSIYLDNTSGFHTFASTVSISGTPNNGTKTFNLDFTYDPNGDLSSNSQRGWNMIPNYFPSNLSVFNLINDANFGTGYKAIHIWNQGTGQMVALNQSGVQSYNTGSQLFSTLRQISPFTGFWVKADNSAQSIQLKNAHRTSRTDSLPANTYFKTDFDVFRIEVKDADGNADQFSTCFTDGATYGFDNTLDLYKFKSFSGEVPTLYTKVGNDMVSLSAMPIETNYTVPVFVESYTDGKLYTVKALTSEYKNYFDVELVDNKTGAKVDLLTDNYTFNFDKNFASARFTLNFNKKSTTSVDELFNQEKMYAYTDDGAINVSYSNNNTAANATVEVYNMMGQKLFSQGNVKSGDVVKYNTAANGQVKVYIVKVISNGKAQTIKVIN